MATKPFLTDGNIVVDQATITNSGTSIVLPTGSTISGAGTILDNTSTTDSINEGANNLYFTNTRADARITLQVGGNLDLSAKTTDDLAEGSTNVYYTDARADARVNLQTGANLSLTAKSTDDLSEGATNLYYTDARSNTAFDTRLATKSTDDLSEGAINLYYTDTRADARISAASITDLSDADQTVQTTDNVTFANITSTGYIAGPATFTIDPAAVGDNTGTVVIAGDLQVDGTTTTINSTTVEIDDLNITLASGAATASAANGAGITIDGASATFTYHSPSDRWEMNKTLTANLAGNVTGTVSDISNHTTDALAEGSTNLYFSGKTTTNLTEGTNLYYTDGRVDTRIALQVGPNLDLSFRSTDNLSEGSTNLYYTDARVQTKLNTLYIENPASHHTHTVTVGTKTTAHPYTGQGSSSAYFLNGAESPSIILAPNQTYRFDQSDNSNTGHPLAFYLEADKTTSYTTGVTTNGVAGQAGSYTQIVVTETTPIILYYQCTQHAYMGSVASSITSAGTGGGSTGDISFSASDISTNADTMNFKVDADNNDTGYEGYYFYGGPTSQGYVRLWTNDAQNETAIKFHVDGTSYYSAMLQRDDQFKMLLNEHSGNIPARIYNMANGNAGHLDLGTRHADGKVRVVDSWTGSLYYALPRATPASGDVLTASDASGTLAWSAPTNTFATATIATIPFFTSGSQAIIDKNGALNIRGNWIRFQKPGTATDMIVAKPDGEVELYHNGSQKLETTASGVTVTGTVTATAFEGDGSALTDIDAAKGGGTDHTFIETDNSVNTSYTLSTNRNAMTVGPVTINSGATVTVPSGQRWIIL